jgi:hypothetical protein
MILNIFKTYFHDLILGTQFQCVFFFQFFDVTPKRSDKFTSATLINI